MPVLLFLLVSHFYLLNEFISNGPRLDSLHYGRLRLRFVLVLLFGRVALLLVLSTCLGGDFLLVEDSPGVEVVLVSLLELLVEPGDSVFTPDVDIELVVVIVVFAVEHNDLIADQQLFLADIIDVA